MAHARTEVALEKIWWPIGEEVRGADTAARQVMVLGANSGRRFKTPDSFFRSAAPRTGSARRGGTGPTPREPRGDSFFPVGLARLRARPRTSERRAQPTARSSFHNDDHRRTRAGRLAGILPAPAGEGARSSATRRVRAAVGATENSRRTPGRGTKREEGEENASRRRGDAAAAPPETRASADRAPLSVRRRPRASRDRPPARARPPLSPSRQSALTPPSHPIHAPRTTSARTTPRRRKRPRA